MTDFRELCAELVDELEDWIAFGDEADCADAHALVDRARAALAQPNPQGPTLDDVSELCEEFGFHLDESYDNLESAEAWWEMFRAAIARWGRSAIEPVPVAERLPGPGDCDAEGCCWVASEDCPAWHRVSRHFDAWHYWLPHHALPVPQQEAE